MRQIHELAIGMIVKGIITVGQGQIMPLLVRIPHAQLGPTHSYVKTMTCMCEFDTSVTAVRLTTQSLQHKLPAHNSQLHEYALKYLEEHFGDDPTGQFSERIRAMLRHFLGSGMGNQLDIAKMLAINPRTLQRRLAFEGKHFEDLVDEVRQEKLQHFLHSDQKRPLSQIAWMLGYAEQSALNRSCLRWFGCSPGALRDKLKISGAAST
jgi:AraC-like DNA-binding protein